ncbi:MAG TPA: YfhO family protein [Actinomycetota bacterium]
MREPGRHVARLRGRAWRPPGPWWLVGASVIFGLVVLAPETRDVWSLNDASIHASMVRWAAGRIRGGHLPLDGWYPYLSFGASRFHHYQSLPHVLTGAASIVTGPATFRWSLYLGLACWPIAVYGGARLFDLEPWAAAVAAVCAPLVASDPGMGYEWGSYVWRGSGAWAQLWGMWFLPFAWGLSWRAVAGRSRVWPAALVLGLTVCVHLLTGYLALLSLGVWVLVAPRRWRSGLVRAVGVGVGALAVSAWMLVPLVADAAWTTQDEFSRGTHFYDSFGAPAVLGWLVRGELFDEGRLPVLSLLAAVGFVVAAIGARRREPLRAILGVGLLSLALFFGRPTLGAVIDLLPGGADLFLRRFLSGVHLAGLWLAGLGAVWLVGVVVGAWHRVGDARRAWIPAAAAAGLVGVLLLPAWAERVHFERVGAGWIEEQARADADDGAAFATLVRRAAEEGPGRIFSESRTVGTASYKIGQVPAYVALLNLDADQVGFTRPTWSVMSGVEHRFTLSRPSDPRLFGVRYVIVPEGTDVPGSFTEVARAGRHVLWMDAGTSYLDVVWTVAGFEADRTNLGARIESVLDSSLPGRAMLPTLAFAGRPAAAPVLGPNGSPDGRPGTVSAIGADPVNGEFAGTVDADGPAVVVLRSSYDPRWEVSVDGEAVATQMLAPGFVGVPVPSGRHDVAFAYRSYPWYGPLFLLAIAALGGLRILEQRRRPDPGEIRRSVLESPSVSAEHPSEG